MKNNLFKYITVFLLIFIMGYLALNGVIKKNKVQSNSDEQIIKEFRSHHKYSTQELKKLEIRYLGTVDNYRIYYVAYKFNDDANDKPFVKDGFEFPVAAETRIIGIKDSQLYTLGNLLHETQIHVSELYKVMPDEYKNLSHP